MRPNRCVHTLLNFADFERAPGTIGSPSSDIWEPISHVHGVDHELLVGTLIASAFYNNFLIFVLTTYFYVAKIHGDGDFSAPFLALRSVEKKETGTARCIYFNGFSVLAESIKGTFADGRCLKFSKLINFISEINFAFAKRIDKTGNLINIVELHQLFLN